MDKQYFKDYYYQHKEEMNKQRLNHYYKRKLDIEDENKIEFYKKNKKVIKMLKDKNFKDDDLNTLLWFINEWEK
jgi:lipase chaperone LimK